MKAENSAEIARRYWIFAAYFVGLLGLSLICILLLHKTDRQQQRRISAEEDLYNRIQNQQFLLYGKVDSVVDGLQRMASPEGAANPYLRGIVNNRRLELQRALRDVDTADFLIYGRLASQVQPALLTKDSSTILRKQSAFLRDEVTECLTALGQSRRQPVDRNSERFR